MDTTFRIVAKAIKESEVIGYQIRGSDDTQKMLRKEDVIKQAKVKRIEGCTVVRHNDTDYIVNKHTRISELPQVVKEIEKLTLTSKLIENGNIIGYVCTESDGRLINISKEKAWELARAGGIDGVEAIIYKKVKTLKAKDINLDKLSKVQV